MDKSIEMYEDLKKGIIHKSILQMFIRCGAQIRFLEIKTTNPELQVEELDEQGQFVLEKGSFFHDFGNYFAQKTNEPEFSEMIEDLFKRNLLVEEEIGELKDRFREYLIPDEEMNDEHSPFTFYFSMLDSFFEFEAKRMVEFAKDNTFEDMMLLWKPYATEIKFDVIKLVDFPDRIVDEYSIDSYPFHVKGTIDRVNRYDLKNKKLEIMEYKTGGWNKDSTSKMTRVRRELAFYSVFNQNMLIDGEEWTVDRISCYNPEVDLKVGHMEEKIKTVTKNSMLKQLLRLVLALEDDDFDRPVCSPYVCSYCRYLDYCGEYFKEQWDETDGYFQDTKDKRRIERQKNDTPY